MLINWYIRIDYFLSNSVNSQTVRVWSVKPSWRLRSMKSLVIFQTANNKNIITSYYRPYGKGIHRWSVDSPCKGPMMRWMCPCQGIITYDSFSTFFSEPLQLSHRPKPSGSTAYGWYDHKVDDNHICRPFNWWDLGIRIICLCVIKIEQVACACCVLFHNGRSDDVTSMARSRDCNYSGLRYRRSCMCYSRCRYVTLYQIDTVFQISHKFLYNANPDTKIDKRYPLIDNPMRRKFDVPCNSQMFPNTNQINQYSWQWQIARGNQLICELSLLWCWYVIKCTWMYAICKYSSIVYHHRWFN